MEAGAMCEQGREDVELGGEATHAFRGGGDESDEVGATVGTGFRFPSGTWRLLMAFPKWHPSRLTLKRLDPSFEFLHILADIFVQKYHLPKFHEFGD